MRVVVEKITNTDDMREACNFTMMNKQSSQMSLETMYSCRHSPMRTQLFKVKMYDIPTSASVHFVRHAAVGQLHFVGTNRPDRRTPDGIAITDLTTLDEWRSLPVDHMMWLNAQHLQEMSWDRLCVDAEEPTRKVMRAIKMEMKEVDGSLAALMVPKCNYLGRCEGLNPC